ncbi:hypothetical protein [Allosphingosinicella sp.]|jgi:hypothetical protein|uniref:hypothetical protein n=1 Tax=Allosphingosinicella sp. TaxID=2823234 RepID=UPI002F0BCC0E
MRVHFRSARLGPALAACAVVAAGCTTEGPFPSLETRPIEQEDPLAEPVRTAAAVAPDPALRARAAELLASAQVGETEFEAAVGEAQAAARGAGAGGTESWFEAQRTLSRLEAATTGTMTALAELDRLVLDRAALPTNEGDFAVIRSALAEAQRIARRQQDWLEPLRAALRR